MKTAIVGLLGAGILATSLFGDRSAEDLYHDMEENDINFEELYYWDVEEYLNMEEDELAFNVFKNPEQYDLVTLHNEVMEQLADSSGMEFRLIMMYDWDLDLFVVFALVGPEDWLEDDEYAYGITDRYADEIFDLTHEALGYDEYLSSGAIILGTSGEILSALDENYDVFYFYGEEVEE